MVSSDKEYFDNMLQQIEEYRGGSITLSELTGNLMVLRDSLSEIEPSWERKFTSYIADLESAYAYALEKNDGNLDPVSEGVVETALPGLAKMIDDQSL